MKKHQIVATVGTLALVANLLLPNLAFGQQNANQNVGCPGAGIQEFNHVPGATTLTALTAGTGGNTVDNSLAGASTVGSGNLLTISDLTSGGANGCTTVGGSITAMAGDFVNAVSNTIPASSLRLVTTTNVTTDGAYDTIFPPATRGTSIDGAVTYDRAPGPGDNHDVTAPQQVATPAATLSTTANVTAYTLADPAQNTFGSGAAVDVLRYCTPKNSVFGAGVALALQGVPATQAAGSYHTTITYSKSPLNCAGTSAGTISVSMASGSTATGMTSGSTATGMIVSVNDGLGNAATSVGKVFSIGAEYVTVTAHNDSTSVYTVSRGQLGTTAVAHNAGTIIYNAGTNYTAGLVGGTTVAATTLTTTVAVRALLQVGDTLIINEPGNIEHVRVTSVAPTDGISFIVERGTDGTTPASHAQSDLVKVS